MLTIKMLTADTGLIVVLLPVFTGAIKPLLYEMKGEFQML